MESNTTSIKHFFETFITDLKAEAVAKDQKIPVDSFRFEADETSGTMYAADYFQYILFGRGPGKAPPVDAMRAWVEKNPDSLEAAKQRFKYITANGLAYIIGQKIAREGTDIFTGKKPAIDFLGVMDKNMEVLLKSIAHNEAFNVATSLRSAIK
jgi:hypothetical protein